jgi:EAL domain-containing protein (putative c-di-GMP-specific phosphodiesterase class I)
VVKPRRDLPIGSLMTNADKTVGRILLVDDEPALPRTIARILRRAGHEVEIACNGRIALERLRSGSFDAVFSDISMPEMSGTDLLASARDLDPTLPVVLMTARPTMDSAIAAVARGAMRYLVKPVGAETLTECAEEAVRLRRQNAGAGALAAQFARAVSKLWMAYQPIVSCAWNNLHAHEALVRSDEPDMGNPAVLLNAAERLEQLPLLGRAIRAQVAAQLPQIGGQVFINLHPLDLLDADLFDRAAPLSAVASRITLEMTERAALGAVDDLEARIAELRAMGYRVAIDDLGEGYAGLTSFARLAPEYVKLDMSLVRNLDSHPFKQRIVRALVKLCDELGVVMIAEGVETAAEKGVLLELGCDLMQGYLFGRPARR